MVKKARDAFKISKLFDHFLNPIVIHRVGGMRYMFGMTFRKTYFKIDEVNNGVFFGLTPDPPFIGKDQGQGLTPGFDTRA